MISKISKREVFMSSMAVSSGPLLTTLGISTRVQTVVLEYVCDDRYDRLFAQAVLDVFYAGIYAKCCSPESVAQCFAWDPKIQVASETVLTKVMQLKKVIDRAVPKGPVFLKAQFSFIPDLSIVDSYFSPLELNARGEIAVKAFVAFSFLSQIHLVRCKWRSIEKSLRKFKRDLANRSGFSDKGQMIHGHFEKFIKHYAEGEWSSDHDERVYQQIFITPLQPPMAPLPPPLIAQKRGTKRKNPPFRSASSK